VAERARDGVADGACRPELLGKWLPPSNGSNGSDWVFWHVLAEVGYVSAPYPGDSRAVPTRPKFPRMPVFPRGTAPRFSLSIPPARIGSRAVPAPIWSRAVPACGSRAAPARSLQSPLVDRRVPRVLRLPRESRAFPPVESHAFPRARDLVFPRASSSRAFLRVDFPNPSRGDWSTAFSASLEQLLHIFHTDAGEGEKGRRGEREKGGTG
jgi:hypothetical protein